MEYDKSKRCWNCQDFQGIRNPDGLHLGQCRCLKYDFVMEFKDKSEWHSYKCIKQPKVIDKPENEITISDMVKLNPTPKGRPKKMTANRLFENMENEVIE